MQIVHRNNYNYCNKFKHSKRVASICVCAKVRQLQSCMCLCVFAGGADSRHWQKNKVLAWSAKSLPNTHHSTHTHWFTCNDWCISTPSVSECTLSTLSCNKHTVPDTYMCCIVLHLFFSKLEHAEYFNSHFYQTKTHLVSLLKYCISSLWHFLWCMASNFALQPPTQQHETHFPHYPNLPFYSSSSLL